MEGEGGEMWFLCCHSLEWQERTAQHVLVGTRAPSNKAYASPPSSEDVWYWDVRAGQLKWNQWQSLKGNIEKHIKYKERSCGTHFLLLLANMGLCRALGTWASACSLKQKSSQAHCTEMKQFGNVICIGGCCPWEMSTDSMDCGGSTQEYTLWSTGDNVSGFQKGDQENVTEFKQLLNWGTSPTGLCKQFQLTELPLEHVTLGKIFKLIQ